jgi:hypothetical protein
MDTSGNTYYVAGSDRVCKYHFEADSSTTPTNGGYPVIVAGEPKAPNP